MIRNSDKENIRITTDSEVWLMNNDPEFSRRINKDLDRFRKYFRTIIEAYLQKKENKLN